MKRICASIEGAVFFSVVAGLFLPIPLLALFSIPDAIAAGENFGAELFGFTAFGVIDSFFWWCANRYGCWVWYEDGTIKRRGLFGGFEREIPVDQIRSVVVQHFHKQGDFYILIDDSPLPLSYIRKDSSICFRRTKRTSVFVRSFWNGEIENG